MTREKGGSRTLSAQRIFATAGGYLSSANLKRAMRAGVFQALGSGPASAAGLSTRTGMTVPEATDLLDTLVALGLLRREGGLYSNTPEASYYLDPASPAYAGAMIGAIGIAA